MCALFLLEKLEKHSRVDSEILAECRPHKGIGRASCRRRPEASSPHTRSDGREVLLSTVAGCSFSKPWAQSLDKLAPAKHHRQIAEPISLGAQSGGIVAKCENSGAGEGNKPSSYSRSMLWVAHAVFMPHWLIQVKVAC